MNRMQKLQVILAAVRVKKFVYRDGQRAWFAKEKISMLLKEAFEKGLSRGEQAEALPLGRWGVSREPQLCLGKALMGSRTICPAQPMPCAGTDTYIKSWKGEEETASTFQKALEQGREEGHLLKRVPVDDNQTRERFCWCTLLISIPVNQGKVSPWSVPSFFSHHNFYWSRFFRGTGGQVKIVILSSSRSSKQALPFKSFPHKCKS